MAKGFKCGGGGGSNLNFSVKVYAAEETLLADTPKENTIGIVTDTAVTGVYFRASFITASEGRVMIAFDGDSSGLGSTDSPNFYAWNTEIAGIASNMTVYPRSCAQYISGAWVNKIAYIYKGGTWVQFSEDVTELALYNAGDQCTDVTGGWEAYSDPGIILASDHIYLMIGSGYVGRQAWTANSVDMSNYSTLNVEVTEWSKLCYLGINDTKPKSLGWSDSNFTNKDDCEQLAEITANGVVSMDISAVSGSYFVWLAKPGQNADYAGCKVTKVWLSN